MAAYTIEAPPAGTEFPEGVRVVKWTLTTADPTGTPYIAPHRPDKSVHAFGTFGGATVQLQGSNEVAAAPTDWQPLTDPQGNAITKTAAALEQVLENTYQVRPQLTVVGAGATITVYLLIGTTARR